MPLLRSTFHVKALCSPLRGAWLCAVLMMSSAAALAQAWVPIQSRDAMLDKPRLSLLLSPVRVDGALRGDRPSLILRCAADGRLEAYISTRNVVDAYRYDVSVMLRWMDDAPVNEIWGRGDGMTSAFAPDPKAFMEAVLANTKLRVRVPMYSSGDLTAHYTLPRISQRHLQQFEQRCGLATAGERAAREAAREKELAAREQASLRFVPPLVVTTPSPRLDSLKRREADGREEWLAAVARDSSTYFTEYVVTDKAGRRYRLPRALINGNPAYGLDILDDLPALDFAIYVGSEKLTQTEIRVARWALATGRCLGVHGIAKRQDGSAELVCTSGSVPFKLTVP